MTRINCVPPEELCNQHLLAEYREIVRVRSYLYKSIDSGIPIKIPAKYCMGGGHVKFFYDKFMYLKLRYVDLYTELTRRGYNVKPVSDAFSVSGRWNNNWKPTVEDRTVNRQRLAERMPAIPAYYLKRKD